MSLKKQFFKTKDTCKITFSLPKEAVGDGKKVQLLGDFNQWKMKKAIPMKLRSGQYSATVELETGKEYQFKYVIDDTTWENDWAPDGYAMSSVGVENSVVNTEKPT